MAALPTLPDRDSAHTPMGHHCNKAASEKNKPTAGAVPISLTVTNTSSVADPLQPLGCPFCVTPDMLANI